MTWQAPFLCGFADKLKHRECPHKSEDEGHDMPRFGMQRRMLLLEPRVQQLMMVCSDGGVSGEREDDRCAVAHHAA